MFTDTKNPIIPHGTIDLGTSVFCTEENWSLAEAYEKLVRIARW